MDKIIVTVPLGYKKPTDGSAFRVGDVIRYADGRPSAIITEVHIKTAEEEAAEQRRAEMTAKEAAMLDHTCPECGHQWDDE